MKNTFFLIVGFIIILGSIFLLFERNHIKERGFMMLEINGVSVKAEIADTQKARERGLSGRKAIGEGMGMLFVFDTPARHGFWMKDMRFPIDILWIDENSQIVWMEEGVLPESFPQVFYPESSALYVLELPANFSGDFNVETGIMVNFNTQNVQNQ